SRMMSGSFYKNSTLVILLILTVKAKPMRYSSTPTSNFSPEVTEAEEAEESGSSGDNGIEVLEFETFQPCPRNPCGSNTRCEIVNGWETCSCAPGYRGWPIEGCERAQECRSDNDCPQTQRCNLDDSTCSIDDIDEDDDENEDEEINKSDVDDVDDVKHGVEDNEDDDGVENGDEEEEEEDEQDEQGGKEIEVVNEAQSGNEEDEDFSKIR
ncbi:hypothetical protein QAD02_009782, partial [Eretmocerus hayati]